MRNTDTTIELVASDLGGFTVDDIVCTNCIEGYCPARTTAVFREAGFTMCGAKKNSDVVLATYQQRTGIVLEIERPC